MDFLTVSRQKCFLHALLLIQLTCCIAYCFMPFGGTSFPPFLIVYSVHFLAFGFFLLSMRKQTISLKVILAVAVLARLVLIYSSPIMEDDFWRYLWDGRVLAHGINPYKFKPLDPALDFLATSYRHHIGWKEYGTIYPPVSIGVFAIAHLLAPDSLIFLKLILVIFDLGTSWIIFQWLRSLGAPPKWVLVYLLNPLVLKEVANSSHLDAIVVFFSALAGFLIFRSAQGRGFGRHSLFGWIALAFAVASKLYPLIFIPLFLKIDRKRWRGLLAFAVVLLALYLPVFDAGAAAWNGAEGFARNWIFNAGFYRIIERASLYGTEFFSRLRPDVYSEFWAAMNFKIVAKATSVFLLMAFVLCRAWRMRSPLELPKEMLSVVGALLILSPVVNAWYVLWLLPFAAIVRSVPWVAFSYLVVAAYSWWYSPDLALYFRWAEYLVFFWMLWRWSDGEGASASLESDSFGCAGFSSCGRCDQSLAEVQKK